MNARSARVLEAAKEVARLEERLAGAKREFHRLLGEDDEGALALPRKMYESRKGLRERVLEVLAQGPMRAPQVAAQVEGADFDVLVTTL